MGLLPHETPTKLRPIEHLGEGSLLALDMITGAQQFRLLACLLAACAIACPAGCSRSRFRWHADRDAYQVLSEKAEHTPWVPEAAFEVMPGPESRLFDPSPIDFPQLPSVAPSLYAYELPELHADAAPEPEPIPEPLPAPSAIRRVSGSQTEPATGDETGAENQEVLPPPEESAADIDISPIVIPASAWKSIPAACRVRVLEFESARNEYLRTYGRPLTAAETDLSPKLTLDQIVELALLNSREYQTKKERLYRTALRLTFERFQFDLKFSALPGVNQGELDYRHSRSTASGTVNTLSLPSSVQVDKVLYTGGDLLARLANDIVLTFNGPQGFATDLSSELLVQVTQSVFQRDIRFESLTQAERNVIYSARDLVRFRKELFNDLAAEYYNVLLTYRQVEIDSLNYFTLVRAQVQRGQEHRVGLAPRVQVDQIEQNALSGVTNLTGTCNRLERQLDALKQSVGVPTETRLNVDLRELASLAAADDAAVAGQLVLRVRTRLKDAAQQSDADRGELLRLAVELVARMQKAIELGGEEPEGVDRTRLAALQAHLQVYEAHLVVQELRKFLEEDAADPTVSPVRLLHRNLELIAATIRLLAQQAQLASRLERPSAVIQEIRDSQTKLSQRLTELEARFDSAIDELAIPRIADLLKDAEQLRTDADQAAKEAGRVIGIDLDRMEQREVQAIVQQVEELLQKSEQLLERRTGGLIPVEISFDDAMLTALVLRLNLMNQRGFLADDWRQVKLAADNLKSVLNLTASERMEDFRIKDSETRLNVRFEPPLNRFAQRNAFRESLIDFQVGRRALMQLEDEIKFDVRNDLREMALSKQQYELGVASAALAFERVAGTRQQLRLGVAGVQARDFLEAQTAYASALSTVASRHIGYIISRMELFMDLELLEVNDQGVWPELRNPRFQPVPTYEPPHAAQLQPYGPLAPRVRYSSEMRQMLDVPFGEPAIFSPSAPAANADTAGESADEP